MAVPIDEYPERGKSIVKTRHETRHPDLPAAEDIESFRNGFTSRQLRINRLVRWCHQAYDQGALLTQLDLAQSCSTSVKRSSAITSMNGRKVRENSYPLGQHPRFIGRYYPQERDHNPLSSRTSHPTIAAKTKHSKEAVDRYIRDYESVKVVRTATADIDKISHITRLSKRVISQYLDLIPQQQLKPWM